MGRAEGRFGVGSKESKVLVTTRNDSVALATSTTQPYNLKLLSEEDSLSLFLKYAFRDEKHADKYPRLKMVGGEIVKKCGGVPLAAKALGSLLHAKTDEDEWTFVRDHQIWELERDHDDPILSALKLSYITMSSHLKQCFVTCSCFSKNVGEMQSIFMILLWMALGIVQADDDQMEMEDMGKLYFQELCTRSFFQYLEVAEKFYSFSRGFEMHDLIHDLALSILKNVKFTVHGGTKTIPDGVKYLTIAFNEGDDTARLLSILRKPKKAQTLTIEASEKSSFVIETLVSACISRFTNLRVLELRDSSLELLPSSIGTMKHLRFLDFFSNKRLKKLPDSICKLQNLQTLILGGCEELEDLPTNIRNLVSLRALFVTSKQTHFSENGIGRLKSLRFLHIIGCQNLESLPQDMRYCTTLRTLMIERCEKLNLAKGPDEFSRLSIQRLFVAHLPQTTGLPQWIRGAFETLQYLIIQECPNLVALPEWMPNLTSLQQLVIHDCPSLTSLPDGAQRLNSLTDFEIVRCGALEERCRRQVGEDWHKISHVSSIRIGESE